MEIIADLHVHSRHSQATSKDLNLQTMEKWAKVKGVSLLGTGDFTHPKWIEEIKTELTDDGSGILRSKSDYPFLLQTEISLIYTDKGRGRKIHHCVYAPDLDAVSKITKWLLTKGRVDYDGRPIFGIPSTEFVETLKGIDERIEIIPAHIWTPWFSVLGDKGGYDSLKDCFEDTLKHIKALETGLSSDPPMNHRVKELDRFTLVSNSDLHSYWPWRMGREANVFELKELSYANVFKAINDGKGFVETLEVDPAFGKYHWTGHRNCKVNLSPKEALKVNNICPVCKKPLTVGVEQRVEALADRDIDYVKKDSTPFSKLIPLSDIISSVLQKAVATKTVWSEFHKLVNDGRSELDVLRNTSEEELAKLTTDPIRSAILKNRAGDISVIPGYDGEYGIPQFVDEVKLNQKPLEVAQRGLGDFM